MNNIKIGSNKSFGVFFSIVFLLISLYPLINSEEIKVWSLIISLVFLVLGILNSKILTPLNKLWFKFGILLGSFVSPIVMGVIFFFVVTPTAILMRIIGKDLLNLKRNKKKSYWVKRPKLISKMKNQF